jgi:hypothetical protein
MPRGSKPGQRRGGRQRGTPNRRTILTDRILAITSEHPTVSQQELVVILVNDQKLAADTRMAIARKFLPARARSAEGGLEALLRIAQDGTVSPPQRRKAALAAAQYLLPKIPTKWRWLPKGPPDQYRFINDAKTAREYRDALLRLRLLRNSGSSNPLDGLHKANKLRARIETIRSRLGDRCPCPSLYTIAAFREDRNRLIYLADKRANNVIFTEQEDAEEVLRRARSDAYEYGPEQRAKKYLAHLRDIERRRKARPLTIEEQYDLRLLSVLYSTNQSRDAPHEEVDETDNLLQHAPVAADGNIYPHDSRLRPAPPADFEEFVWVPPYVIGNPNRPDAVWLDENFQPVTFP